MRSGLLRRAERDLPVPGLAGVALAGLVAATAIPLPFTGDQAFYTLGGRALSQGRLLYRDFWDVKQPGIFVFYQAAGGLFGFHEFGVHLFELVWQLVLALLVVRVVREHIRHAVALVAAPLLTVGAYYALASPLQLTQLEALVALPVLGAIWFGITATRREPSRLALRMALFGGCCFVVAAFKLMLLVVPLACVAVVIVLHVRGGGTLPARFARRCILPAALAFVLPSASYIAWAAARGLLPEIMHTWFVFPLGLAGRAGRSVATLRGSLMAFVRLTAPLLALAAIGAREALPRRRNPIAQASVVWLATGSITYLLQLWWLYQLFFFLVPLGILATYGLDTVCGWSPRRAFAPVAAVLAALALLPGGAAHHFGSRTAHLAENGFALGDHNLASFRAAEWPQYSLVGRQHAFLHAAETQRGVVVWGNPLYLYLSDREPAIGVSGWSAEQIDGQLWRQAARELDQAKPALVFIDASSARYMAVRGPDFEARVHRDYRLAGRTTDGVWYERIGT